MYRSVLPVHFTDDEIEVIYFIVSDHLDKTEHSTLVSGLEESLINKIKECGVFYYEDVGDTDES